jgi:hypothetical protein
VFLPRHRYRLPTSRKKSARKTSRRIQSIIF